MFGFHCLFTLALVSVTWASRIDVRQATNTNAAINQIIDTVDEAMHQVGPTILTIQANHTMNSATLGNQFSKMETTFKNMDNQLLATPVSSGSTTVSPTNDEISITLSDSMQLVASSLSGVQASGTVPDFSNMVATLDPIIANALTHYNHTLPGALMLVHTMMLDASQFLRAEGFTGTLAALNF
ncbi:Small subunit of laccase POXA3a [Mycena venus]|uniref:Small subunit of laccase POXA3a n=1 Tax=Mycena venus TaxID=2733690 RepID=A0A8H6X6N9_9AGAR|nr:Small subunit of laccase POXA3a [Mycena venus]